MFYFNNKLKSILRLSNKSGAGFTLVEMMMAMAIFLFITAATVDVFLFMVTHQKRALQEQELLNQTSYAMEYMSSAIKNAVKEEFDFSSPDDNCLLEGHIYDLVDCNNGPTGTCSGIRFATKKLSLFGGDCKTLTFVGGNDLLEYHSEFGAGALPIIGNKFIINHGYFILNGDKTLRSILDTDTVQPKITILLDVSTQPGPDQQQKVVQTTVSQRELLGTGGSTSLPPGYTKCADEGYFCNFSGSANVAFGAKVEDGGNGNFIILNLTDGTSCSTAAFGGDPNPYVAKACYK